MPLAISQALESDFSNPLGMLGDCHRRIARFLEALISVTEQARGGGLNDEQREALEKALTYFHDAAPKHTADEEDSLFPRVRARTAGSGKRSALLTLLHADHLAVVERHHAVERLGRAWIRDGLGTEDTQHLLDLLYWLRKTYQEHIEIEETQLFPFAARVLSKSDLREIGREMAQRREVIPRGIE
jgi:hemerythrin-like domain-containing protein